MKTKNIKDLEKKLKEKTGEGKLPIGIDAKTRKKTFKINEFLRLAEEMRRIFSEDEYNKRPAF